MPATAFADKIKQQINGKALANVASVGEKCTICGHTDSAHWPNGQCSYTGFDIGGPGKCSCPGMSYNLLDSMRYVDSIDVSYQQARFLRGQLTAVIRRIGAAAMPLLTLTLNDEGRASWRATDDPSTLLFLPAGSRLVATPAVLGYRMRLVGENRRYFVNVSGGADEKEDNDIYAKLTDE